MKTKEQIYLTINGKFLEGYSKEMLCEEYGIEIIKRYPNGRAKTIKYKGKEDKALTGSWDWRAKHLFNAIGIVPDIHV